MLRLAPDVRTRFDAAGHVLLDAPDGTVVDIGPRGYEILSVFTQPLALGLAIERLGATDRRATDVVPSLSIVNVLVEEGALVVGGDEGASSGWADPVEHGRMLHDERRTGAFLAALERAVQPGDVVLDIGTGSGVLALGAVRAGARHVYAVEASDIADVAERVFATNGCEDSVTLIRGWSRRIELPEPADVLVTEIIGNEPFEEDVLETTLDARRRLLRPGARLLPHALTLFARPLLLPPEEARQRALGREAIERWQALYAIDFEPLADAAAQHPVNSPTEAEVAARWPQVGPPVILGRVDLTSFEEAKVKMDAILGLDAPGAVNAIAITFRAELHGQTAHTLDPWQWPTSSWATSVWVLPDAIEVERGAAVRVSYRRRVPGCADGLTCDLVAQPDFALIG